MRVLIVGCGYVGLPLGERLVRAGHSVFGLKRSTSPEISAAGIEPLSGDVTDLSSLKGLPSTFDWVINSVAAGGGGPDQYREVYLEGTRNLIAWLRSSPPKAFVYTSSTSVYGQDDGSTVTEDCATTPDGETSRILVETESLLRAAAAEWVLPAVVLRCAGIYGPGRGYWLQQFLSGTAEMDGSGERWLNMIHRDDVGAAVIAALERGNPGDVYNVVDDEPARQREMFEWLAVRLGRPVPQAGSGGAPRRRGATNKRVSNQKLRLELRCELQYPTFREGYEAELKRLGLGRS